MPEPLSERDSQSRDLDAARKLRLHQLESQVKAAGVLDLFDQHALISMQLPDRPHPVACSFLRPPGGGGVITLDLQIGGLSSRGLAVTGCTTLAEADLIGSSISFAPIPSFQDFVQDGGDANGPMADFYRKHCQKGHDSVARDPGKAPRDPDGEEMETLAFALVGIEAAFRATALSPTDIDDPSEGILEITVRGSTEDLLAGKDLDTTWEVVPFDPIQMPPFPTATLARSLRRSPLHGKRSWILHLIPMSVSSAESLDTVQMLFALDAQSGHVVYQDHVMNHTADEMGRALGVIIQGAGYRPGSAITTSPRLDDILGEGLQGLGVRYARRRRLMASDPRVEDLEEFIAESQVHIMADLMGGMGHGDPEPTF
ncbi:MAG: hypothetical protein ACJAQ3_000508 [Planctomycetota bacterium]|jgi:hypothetical protein